MSAPVSRKGSPDARKERHEDRERMAVARWEADRIRRMLESGMKEMDIER